MIQSPDVSPTEHLWVVVEQEILIVDVSRPKLSEGFQQLDDSMPRRIKALLEATGGPSGD